MKKKMFILCASLMLSSCQYGDLSLLERDSSTSSFLYDEMLTPLNPVKKPINETIDKIEDSYCHSLQQFSIDFFKQLSIDENIICSPISIYNCFAMLYEGCDLTSKEQLKETLYIDEDDSLKENIERVNRALSIDNEYGKIDVASSIFIEENYQNVSENYLNLLKDYYYAEVYRGNFKSSILHQTIANWINLHTNSFLKVSKEQFENLEGVMLLLNTIYAKSGWLHPFEQYQDCKDLFYGKKKTSTISFMNQTTYGRVYQTENYEISSLSLSNNLSIRFLLFKEEKENLSSFDEVLQALFNPSNLPYVEGNIHYQVPPFEIHQKYSLNDIFMQLGVSDIFLPQKANLSKMVQNGQNELYVQHAFHEGKIKVNHEGLEAAAYTAIEAGPTSVEKPILSSHYILNRPFFYVIEEKNHLPLFMGYYQG